VRYGPFVRAAYGESVANAGDANGDGVNDIVIGYPGYGQYSVRKNGSVEIVSGLNGKVLYTFNGRSPEDQFGYEVDGAGDFNNDGHADFIIGSLSTSAVNRPSYARVYSGKDGQLLREFSAPSGDTFGSAVRGAGDVNQDGWDDVIIGASRGNSARGYAKVFSGKDSSTLYTFTGTASNQRFGFSVSGAGDVDGDLFPDLVVGSLWDDSPTANNCGSIKVFSGKTGQLLYTHYGATANEYFGDVVSEAGDVDADGHGDYMAMSARTTPNGENGIVRVYSGKTGTLLYTFLGPKTLFSRLGTAIDTFGDFNEDGHTDLVISLRRSGQPGVGRVFSGRDGTIIGDIGGSPDSSFPGSLAHLGDLNGDGSPDLIGGSLLARDPQNRQTGAVWILSGANLKPAQ